MAVLSGFTVVNVALNLPGPLACQRLADLGAVVVKIEPPGGDAMREYDPVWYREMSAGQRIESVDLKSAQGRSRLADLLAAADLLVTSQRPSARARLGLDPDTLTRGYPRLCGVHIVGSVADPEYPGHDLTYQAALDLLVPAQMPRILLADVAGAELAARSAVSVLFARERGMGARHVDVGLQDAAAPFAIPWQRGTTRPEGLLGGRFPGYAVHRTADGYVAVGALEPHFQKRLGAALGVAVDDAEAVRARFAAHPNAHWEALALDQDLPLTALPRT